MERSVLPFGIVDEQLGTENTCRGIARRKHADADVAILSAIVSIGQSLSLSTGVAHQWTAQIASCGYKG